MKTVWHKLGVIAFWLTWPGIWVYLRNTRRTRLIISSGDNKILLTKCWLGSGEWILPGGGLHKGEAALAGAARELQEETGLALDGVELQFIAEQPVSDHGLRYTAVVYRIKLKTTPALRRQKFEISEAEWMPLKDLKNLSPATATLLKLISLS